MKKFKINFRADYKIWEACAKKEKFRPALEYVFFKDGYAYASDANVLVRVPLDLCTYFDDESRDRLNGYAIHGDLLKDIVKYDKVDVAHEVVVRDGVEKVLAVLIASKGNNFIKVYLSDNMSVTPPDFERLLVRPKEMTTVGKIGMRSKLLSSISGAIGSERLKTLFTSERDRIFVIPIEEDNKSVGIMMPYLLLDE